MTPAVVVLILWLVLMTGVVLIRVLGLRRRRQRERSDPSWMGGADLRLRGLAEVSGFEDFTSDLVSTGLTFGWLHGQLTITTQHVRWEPLEITVTNHHAVGFSIPWSTITGSRVRRAVSMGAWGIGQLVPLVHLLRLDLVGGSTITIRVHRSNRVRNQIESLRPPLVR